MSYCDKEIDKAAEAVIEKIARKLSNDILFGMDRKETNADRIRTMSDEELADFLCHIVSNEVVNCSHCIAEEACKMGRNGFIEWLKQPYEKGE